MHNIIIDIATSIKVLPAIDHNLNLLVPLTENIRKLIGERLTRKGNGYGAYQSKQAPVPSFGGYKAVDDGGHDITHPKPLCTSPAARKGRILPEALGVYPGQHSCQEAPLLVKI